MTDSAANETSATGEGLAPRVTIAIPTLNRPHTCELAIHSALDQAGVDCHILVSENGSDPEFAARYEALFARLPERVRVLRQPRRLAVEDHLPALVGRVGTPYVVVLADDDALVPGFVARALALAERGGHAMVFGPYRTEWKASGKAIVREFDYTSRNRYLRILKFVARRNDSFIYGLFETSVLNAGMQEFRPLSIVGRRTLTRIAYAPLFACLLAGSYGHLHGDAVWVGTVDSAKAESYLGRSNVGKLVYLVLGEGVLAARFIRIAAAREGAVFAAAVAPVVIVMAIVEAAGFVLMAARRFAQALLSQARRGVAP